MPADLREFLTDSGWTGEVERLSEKVTRAAESLLFVLEAVLRPTVDTSTIRFVARFLELGDFAPRVSNPAPEIDQAVAERIRQLEALDGLVVYYFRRLLGEHKPADLPSAPSADMIRAVVQDLVEYADIVGSSAGFGRELLRLIDDLRTSVTQSFMLRGGIYPYECACCCLYVEPIGRDEDSILHQLGGQLNRSFQNWVPETAFKGGSSSRLTSSSSFDPTFAMDPQNRVFRPGSGQTRKPGSHRDGRSHR
jgi:hypothetical protein